MKNKITIASVVALIAGIFVTCLQMIFSFVVWFFTIFLCTWYGVAIIMFLAFIIAFFVTKED